MPSDIRNRIIALAQTLISTVVVEHLCDLMNSLKIPYNEDNRQRAKELFDAIITEHQPELFALLDSLKAMSEHLDPDHIDKALVDKGHEITKEFGQMIATEIALAMKPQSPINFN